MPRYVDLTQVTDDGRKVAVTVDADQVSTIRDAEGGGAIIACGMERITVEGGRAKVRELLRNAK